MWIEISVANSGVSLLNLNRIRYCQWKNGDLIIGVDDHERLVFNNVDETTFTTIKKKFLSSNKDISVL